MFSTGKLQRQMTRTVYVIEWNQFILRYISTDILTYTLYTLQYVLRYINVYILLLS